MMSDNIQPKLQFAKPNLEPLPVMLAETIRQAIKGGKLKAGDRLPSEPVFAGQLGVSRTTLRDAVRILISEGALKRFRGIGTFVSDHPLINLQEGLESLFSTTDMIRQQGYEPGTSECDWEIIPAPENLANILDLAPGTHVYHFSRTRTANGIPVIQCEEYLPASMIEPEKNLTRDTDWSLYELLKKSSFAIHSATCKIHPMVADQRLASRLKVSKNHSLLLLRQVHYTSESKPVLYCENYHNSSIIEFHIVRR